MPLASVAAKIVYAPASGDVVHSDQLTRMLYVVGSWARHGQTEKGGWHPADVSGHYVILILAADRSGNVAISGRDLSITIQ